MFGCSMKDREEEKFQNFRILVRDSVTVTNIYIFFNIVLIFFTDLIKRIRAQVYA